MILMPNINPELFGPELWLCGVGLLVLVADLVAPRGLSRAAPALATAGLLLCLKPIAGLWSTVALSDTAPLTAFDGAYAVDSFAVFFKLLFVVCGILVTLLSADFFRRTEAYSEYFSILVFLILGLCLLAGANDLIVLYLSFELVSLSSYLLAAWRKADPKSNEAGLKYFVYGAAASAVMLYGLTLIYGAGGSTNLSVLAGHLMRPIAAGGQAWVAILGVLLMAVGLGYKISMVPFHAWAPDVYEGAPTPVTALLSVGPKAAGFAVMIRVFLALDPALDVPWPAIFGVLAAFSMFAGNLLAIRQTNIKRMLAYSSIAHAGYMLIGFAVGPGEAGGTGELWGITGILVYLVAYLLMNLGTFGIALVVERATGSSEISGFAGLARSGPTLAAVAVVLLLSLTGIPPTGGFLGKFYIFAAAMNSREWAWLAVVGIVNSVISLYYYMNVVRVMYFAKGEGPRIGAIPAPLACAVAVAVVGTLLLFVFPGWLIAAARATSMVY